MYLFQSWKESLLFFKPENFKLFFLITLKTVMQGYKTWFKYFWWLFVVYILPGTDFFAFLIAELIFFSFLLSVRPSVKRKTLKYFYGYRWHFNYFYWLLISILCYTFLKVIPVGGGLLRAIIFPIEVFLILFWLDSRLNIKNFFLSIWRASKMYLFSLPFCFIFFFLPYSVFLLIKYYVPFLFKYFNVFILLFYISFFTNFYIKRLHDQFKLYFKD